MNNLTYQGELDTTNLKYTELAPDKVERFTVRRGDILFNRTKSAELVGKTAMFDRDYPMAYAGYLVRLRVSDAHSPKYLAGFMIAAHTKAALRNMSKSIIGMANINAQEVQSVKIPHPPKRLQQEYARRIDALDDIGRGFKMSASQIDKLFASLQSRAFRGEL